jgi:hypothetical protein
VSASIDHIVIGASSLDEGARWLEDQLGVALSPGGQHPTMGTHNRVLRIGADVYLELIAIDPALAPPPRPVWFSLGEPAVQASVRREPRLLTFVARTDAIEEAAARFLAFGKVESLSRGAFSWRISVPPAGGLIEGGVLPYLIRWEGENRPARSLPASGVSLRSLDLRHPEPDRIATALTGAGFAQEAARDMVASAARPGLTLKLETPRGLVIFAS